MNILNFFFSGFIIGGVGTCIGGLLSILFDKPSNRVVSCLLNFTAGIMLSIISFELIPQSYQTSSFFIVTLGLFSGLIFILCSEELLPSEKLNKYKGKRLDYIKMSIIIVISLSLHNLPEGIALGSSSLYSQDIGLKLSLLIAVHNIPEGMSVGIPLIMAGAGPISVVVITFLTGLPTALGAVIGALLGSISNHFICFCLAAAASSMLYVTANQLIPEAYTLYKGKVSSFFLLAGFVIGCYLSIAA